MLNFDPRYGQSRYGQSRYRQALRDARGIVALEFALTAPFLLTLILGLYDLTHGIQTWRRLSIAAESVAQIASESAAQSNGTNVLTATQVWQASTAAFAIFPTWRNSNETQNYGITLTSAIYATSPPNCTVNCTYTPKTVWSIPFNPGLTNPRPCGTLTQVANGQANSLNQVPVGLAGPSPLIIADVSYYFRPTFLYFITGPISMLRTAYFPPRIGSNTAYVQLTPAGSAGTCPGY